MEGVTGTPQPIKSGPDCVNAVSGFARFGFDDQLYPSIAETTLASKGKLAISSPTAMVMEVLEISGFKPLITICPTRDAAVAALA
ncbi:MAG: hypothetical protein WCQ57_04810 [Verrucomicrobiota bacterium]